MTEWPSYDSIGKLRLRQCRTCGELYRGSRHSKMCQQCKLKKKIKRYEQQ